MNNPIFRNKNNLITYLIIWGLLAITHFLIVFYIYGFNFWISATDSLVFNILYASISTSIWYVIVYSNIEKQDLFNGIINHIAASLIVSTIWIFTSNFILQSIFADNQSYIEFLTNAIALRYIAGVLFYLIIILVYYLLIYNSKIQEKIKHESELKLLLKESEISALKSQINPHFLFNSLNSISSLTISKPDEAQQMIIKLASYLRYSLANDEKNLTKLITEIKNVEDYLEIERIRFGDKLITKTNINKGCEKTSIPVMILQPLYENAIKHGVYESTEQIIIETECKVTNEQLVIIIRNNYDSAYTVKQGEGIGLKNIRNRLNLIYERNNLLLIKNSNGIFEVTLTIPQN